MISSKEHLFIKSIIINIFAVTVTLQIKILIYLKSILLIPNFWTLE